MSCQRSLEISFAFPEILIESHQNIMNSFQIPEGYVCEVTDEDAFIVEKQPSLLRTLPIFIIMLPVTTGCLLFSLISGVILLPIYRMLPLSVRLYAGAFLAWGLLISSRFRLSVHDYNESLQHHSKLYISPHVSLFENVVFFRLLGHFRPVAAHFARTIPIFGFFVHASDPIYVKRKGTKKQGVVELLRESLATTEYKHFIFPEGTYTNGKSLLRFKTGAFAVGEPITPMVCTFTRYTAFWNREESSFWVQLYRIASRWYTPVKVEFLPTYYPSSQEKSDPNLYAENVRKLLSYHTKRPLSKQSLKDSPNYQQDIR